MRRYQLILGVSFLCAAMAIGCYRADTDEDARRESDEVRDLAGRAVDQMAESWLSAKVQVQYLADHDVTGRDIRVTARDGVVRLQGAVDSEREREEALSIARNTDGVERIDDQLRIGAAALA